MILVAIKKKKVFHFSDTHCAVLNDGKTADHIKSKNMDPFPEDSSVHT